VISYADIEHTLLEWHQWRNIDHRMLNDGNPTKVAVGVDLFIIEQEIELVIKDLKLSLMSTNEEVADQNYKKLCELVCQYQHNAYINLLKGEH
jgi:hypothetical protein